MTSVSRIAFYMAVLSAAAVGGGCMTGDVDGDETPAGLEKEAASSLAVSPTVSPSDTRPGPVDIDGALPGEPLSCPTFSFCPIVWDSLNREYKIFYLDYCHTYKLSNFVGSGYYLDKQTSGTITRFYDRSMNELHDISPITSPKGLTGIGWTPVWYIKNC